MKKMSYLLMLLSILVVSCQETQSNQNNSDSNNTGIFEKLSKDAFAKKMEEKTNEILIDVRTPEENKNGTITNAININFYDKNFEEQLLKLDKSKPIFVFCKSGGRSGKACSNMKDLEFKEVYELKGGYSGWKK